MQIILLFAVIIASVALLVASHRIGHRLFVVVSALVGLLAAAILAAILFDPGRGVSSMDPEGLQVRLDTISTTETGYRIEAVVHNYSENALAETDILVRRICDGGRCSDNDTDRFTLLLHVPAGASYPFSHVVDIPPQPLQAPEWEISIEAARAYRNNH